MKLADRAARPSTIAPAKCAGALELELPDERPQLVQRPVVRDLDRSSWSALVQEMPVSREEDAVFRLGQLNERRIVKRGIVEGVEPEDAAPSCEASEHGVRDKAW